MIQFAVYVAGLHVLVELPTPFIRIAVPLAQVAHLAEERLQAYRSTCRSRRCPGMPPVSGTLSFTINVQFFSPTSFPQRTSVLAPPLRPPPVVSAFSLPRRFNVNALALAFIRAQVRYIRCSMRPAPCARLNSIRANGPAREPRHSETLLSYRVDHLCINPHAYQCLSLTQVFIRLIYFVSLTPYFH